AIAALQPQASTSLPACVLLDIRLPSKSGLEVLSWIRSQPRIKRVPVVMLTSSLLPQDINEAYDLAANSYLIKPPNSEVLVSLAARGVFIGSSSWKYPGWRGMLYQEDRYIWQGRFSESRFGQLCLGEYSEVFKTVCVDAAYYKFPDRKYLETMASAVPDDFL